MVDVIFKENEQVFLAVTFRAIRYSVYVFGTFDTNVFSALVTYVIFMGHIIGHSFKAHGFLADRTGFKFRFQVSFHHPMPNEFRTFIATLLEVSTLLMFLMCCYNDNYTFGTYPHPSKSSGFFPCSRSFLLISSSFIEHSRQIG